MVVEAMKEVGIDISKQKSKELTDEMMRESDNVINMGCMDKKFLSNNMVTKSYRMESSRPKREIYRKS
jgi:arsenate reductase (thioredoxin)